MGKYTHIDCNLEKLEESIENLEKDFSSKEPQDFKREVLQRGLSAKSRMLHLSLRSDWNPIDSKLQHSNRSEA